MTSILQPWVMELDTAAKHAPSKMLARCLRQEILVAHCGDAEKSNLDADRGEVGARGEADVLGADQAPPPTPCGAPTVPILIIQGSLLRASTPSKPEHTVGPGEVTSIPPFLCEWREVR